MSKKHKKNKQDKRSISTNLIRSEDLNELLSLKEENKSFSQDETEENASKLTANNSSSAENHSRIEREKLTSYDLVERFKHTYALRIFNGDTYIYNGDIYECVTKELVIALMQECITAGEAKNITFAKYSDAASMLLARRTAGLEIAKLEKSHVLFENGLYNVKEKKLKPYLGSKNFCLVRLKTKFNPDKKTECPVFDSFLETVSGGDKQIKNRILAMLGYCMIPEQDGKVFFVLGTAPNSGKSILAQFLERLFGDDKVSHVALQDFDGQFDLFPLLNKVLNTAMDLDAEIVSKKSVSRMKNLTGGDKTQLNGKFKDHLRYANNAKFLFATNDPIVTTKTSEAFYERLLFIPFNYSVDKEKQDKELLEKLWDERNAIIKKALKAARKLIENNYIFPECEAADFIVDNWRYGKNISISYFVNAKCTITNDKSVKSHTAVLYEAYEKFCEKNNFEPTSVKQFSHALTENFGLLQGRWLDENRRSLHGFFGITLKSEKSKNSEIYYNINME